jgi:hypothetical protein
MATLRKSHPKQDLVIIIWAEMWILISTSCLGNHGEGIVSRGCLLK